MPFLHRDILVAQVDATVPGPTLFKLERDIVYEGRSDTFTVPAGYATDFASVPRLMQWLVSPTGVYTAAAIVHDYLITDVLTRGRISSTDVDGLFRRMLGELGVGVAKRLLMWAGVRWGALFNPLRRGGWRKSALAVLAVSVVWLPVVAPGGVGVLVSLLLAWLVSLPARLFKEK